ncbi:hypothetical protein VNO77_19451 [Canavalia gladiata]|uniref:Uncharacterized protein n=1 Tax=Canavalia gladiata TaxID=3824 RepID=A0AAN9LMR1_CANGL
MERSTSYASGCTWGRPLRLFTHVHEKFSMMSKAPCKRLTFTVCGARGDNLVNSYDTLLKPDPFLLRSFAVVAHNYNQCCQAYTSLVLGFRPRIEIESIVKIQSIPQLPTPGLSTDFKHGSANYMVVPIDG